MLNKKISALLALTLILGLFGSSAFATDIIQTEDLIDEEFINGAPIYDPGPPNIDPEQSVLEREERAFRNGERQPRAYPSSSYITITNVQQGQENWCGPASAQMALRAFNGKNVDQTVFAKAFKIYDTKTLGTYIYDLQTALKSYGMDTVVANVGSSNLKDNILTSVYWYYPPILQVNTSKLTQYNGKTSYHYIVVSGYSGYSASASNFTIQYRDPNYTSAYYGTKTDSYSNIEASLWAYNGWYLY